MGFSPSESCSSSRSRDASRRPRPSWRWRSARPSFSDRHDVRSIRVWLGQSIAVCSSDRCVVLASRAWHLAGVRVSRSQGWLRPGPRSSLGVRASSGLVARRVWGPVSRRPPPMGFHVPTSAPTPTHGAPHEWGDHERYRWGVAGTSALRSLTRLVRGLTGSRRSVGPPEVSNLVRHLPGAKSW
jgi:hypothetical protein